MENNNTNTHYRTCNLCEAMCGLKIQTSAGKIVSIKGDPSDPLSRGHICAKAVALQDLHEDPDRLRQPMKRTRSGWQEISWKEAFNTVEQQIKSIQYSYGNDAVGFYAGNPNTHNHGSILSLLPFLKALKTKNRFSATSNDQLPHMLVNLKMFGHQGLFPIPDIDHTDLFICIGGNPLASNGSLMTAPDIKARLKAIQRRGGKVIVIDPRHTETAALADQHLFIKPGSDALLLLAMLNVIFEEGLTCPGRLSPYLEDIGLLEIACAAYSPRSVAAATGVAAKDIRALALQLAAADRGVIYSRMGTSTQQFGTLSTWLVYCLNILTGKLDKRGGVMFTRPAVDIVELGAMANQQGHFDRYRSRVRKLPEFSDELPSATMADEILTEGKGKIRAMITSAGNPVLSSPNGKELDRAFASLDFMVSIDFYLNETTRHANIILPPTGPLEHSHYDVVFNMVSIRNTTKYSPALFTAPAGSKHDWEIFLELTKRLSARDLPSRLGAELHYQSIKQLGIDGLLDLMLRSGPYGARLKTADAIIKPLAQAVCNALPASHPLHKLLAMGPYGESTQHLSKGLSIDVLRQHPHGLDLGPLQPCLPERIYHTDKRIRIAPKLFLKDLNRLNSHFGLHHKTPAKVKEQATDTLLLIGRRDIRSNNSWLHNSHRLVKGKNRCTLLLHPEDATRLKITTGQAVKLKSAIGELVLAAEIDPAIMPGVVSMPHGWGHNRTGTQLSIAQTKAGESMNDITDHYLIDALSGTSVLNGIEVMVERVTSG
jgi:anaerobic selenocysteine-containing dehydrogenase